MNLDIKESDLYKNPVQSSSCTKYTVQGLLIQICQLCPKAKTKGQTQLHQAHTNESQIPSHIDVWERKMIYTAFVPKMSENFLQKGANLGTARTGIKKSAEAKNYELHHTPEQNLLSDSFEGTWALRRRNRQTQRSSEIPQTPKFWNWDLPGRKFNLWIYEMVLKASWRKRWRDLPSESCFHSGWKKNLLQVLTSPSRQPVALKFETVMDQLSPLPSLHCPSLLMNRLWR